MHSFNFTDSDLRCMRQAMRESVAYMSRRFASEPARHTPSADRTERLPPPTKEPDQPVIALIMAWSADLFNIPRAKILADTNTRLTSDARRVAMIVMRDTLDLTPAQIARHFNRTRPTVAFGISDISRLITHDKEIAARYNTVMALTRNYLSNNNKNPNT